MTLIHLDIRSHTPSKEYLARIYYALEPLLEYANDDVKLGEWLFVDYIAFGNQFPLEEDGILHEILKSTVVNGETMPALLRTLRDHLAPFFENPDYFIFSAFLGHLTYALDGITFGQTGAETITEKVMKFQRVSDVFFDLCRPDLRRLYNVPILCFKFKHFRDLAERCASQYPEFASVDYAALRARIQVTNSSAAMKEFGV
ncbi:hypothetical protein AAVH_32206 [Aphelenchoides avenae]|nr:hypothetical protein AAVH_32206 [Aphelenchus avenae]